MSICGAPTLDWGAWAWGLQICTLGPQPLTHTPILVGRWVRRHPSRRAQYTQTQALTRTQDRHTRTAPTRADAHSPDVGSPDEGRPDEVKGPSPKTLNWWQSNPFEGSAHALNQTTPTRVTPTRANQKDTNQKAPTRAQNKNPPPPTNTACSTLLKVDATLSTATGPLPVRWRRRAQCLRDCAESSATR